jgi:glycosyltransferase involved in cell wall biosynthesis
VEQPVTSSKPNLIEISVVVPVRDEENSIRALLDHLLGQTLRPNEIVITDGGSVDGTRSIIQEFIDRGAPVTLLTDSDSLPGRSRNIAAANARNNWLAFIDAGIRPEHNWLQALADQIVQPAHADVVYGSYEPVIDSFFTECAAIAYVPPPAMTEEGPVRPYSIASALMPREAWEKAGGFPEHLRSAEDLVFMQRVEAAGFRIVRAPSAVVHWSIQPGLWRTFMRFVVYARNNMRAGLWRNWQRQIFIRYGLIILTAIPPIFLSAHWLIVPIGLWLALMTARALRALGQNRLSYPATIKRNVLRLLLIIPILAVIDLATFIGTGQWLLLDSWAKHKRTRSKL